MDYIYIGEIVNTHGIKGEVRIISNFKHKDKVFKKGLSVYVSKKHEELKIVTYRIHKQFDMLTFEGISSINDVLVYKGEKIYVKRDSLKDIVLNEDLVNFDVIYNNEILGKVTEIINNNAHDIFIVDNDSKHILIPYVKEFIKNIDMDNKKIYVNEMSGLIDEN